MTEWVLPTQVWIAYALFEVQAMTDEEGEPIEDEGGDPELTRKVLTRGYDDLRSKGLKEEVRLSLSYLPFRFPLSLIDFLMGGWADSESSCWKPGKSLKSSTERRTSSRRWKTRCPGW